MRMGRTGSERDSIVEEDDQIEAGFELNRSEIYVRSCRAVCGQREERHNTPRATLPFPSLSFVLCSARTPPILVGRVWHSSRSLPSAAPPLRL